jgi:hypothetical protein
VSVAEPAVAAVSATQLATPVPLTKPVLILQHLPAAGKSRLDPEQASAENT